MNSQITFHKRPALAVLLMGLSASTVLAQVNSVRVKGHFVSRFTGSVDGATLRSTGTGAGTASQIGPFTITLTATVELATGLAGSGTFQLVAANGDVINGSYVGRALPENIPKGSHFIGLLTITRGAGRFQGARGGLTADLLFDDTNIPAFNMGYSSLTGTISTPGSTK
jgi:hypothetical protein